MRTRKSWREKMNNPNLPKVVEITAKMQKRFGGGTMVLPSGNDVESVIRGIRKGKVMPVSRIRAYLAGKYSVETACPLVTGIMVRLTAEAAEEDARAGKSRIAPYWRVVKDDGSLYPKFPGGIEQQAQKLREEGHRIVNGKVVG